MLLSLITSSDGSSPAASSSGSSAPSSADWANGAPHSSPAWSASPTSVTQGQWGQPSASASGSGSYASANVTVDWPHSSANESYPTGAPSSSTGQHGSQISSWTVSGTSTAVASNSTAAPGGGSPGNWQAPHYVIYTDYGEMNIPDVSELKDFNRFILAFWLSDRGAVDMAQVWEWMDAGARQKVSPWLTCRVCPSLTCPGTRLLPRCRYRLDGVCFRIDRCARHQRS